MGQLEKHFTEIRLTVFNDSEKGSTLQENTFSDLTFDSFYGFGINKISEKAFGKSAQTIKKFWCLSCELQNTQNHNIWKVLGQLNKLNSSTIGLNVTEIPSNAFTNNSHSDIRTLQLFSKHNLTVKTNAFYNLNNLTSIQFNGPKLLHFGKEGFKFSSKSDEKLHITFDHANPSFDNGTFDSINRPVNIVFSSTNVTFIPESSFKTVLNNNQSVIEIINSHSDFYVNSYINCSDCRNQWLIKQNKQKQVKSGFCLENHNQTLFDNEIKHKLTILCK